jgi:hypothetical protein
LMNQLLVSCSFFLYHASLSGDVSLDCLSFSDILLEIDNCKYALRQSG